MVLATQTPLTRVLPAPHPTAACVIMLSGSWTGATGIACADDARAKTKVTATILIMSYLHSGASLEAAAEDDCLAIGLKGNNVAARSKADIVPNWRMMTLTNMRENGVRSLIWSRK